MSWTLTDRQSAVIVELNSSAVNKQNPEYFVDLHEAFDTLDRQYPGKPIILTAKGKVFSAGIDFEYCFPMFARQDTREIAKWFADYRATMLRVFNSPRLTIAAINGHAIAGGLILALCCDSRIGVAEDIRYALNEVPIGIPMPSIFSEIICYRIGNRAASEAILFGKSHSAAEAKQIGFISEVVPADALLGHALDIAASIPKESWLAYAQSKRNLAASVMKRIEINSPELDIETLKVISAPDSRKSQSNALERLKARHR